MTTIGPARRIHNSVNDLIKNTIIDVEKVLNGLPTSDERVDVVSMPEHRASNEINISIGKDRRISSSASYSSAGQSSSTVRTKYTDDSKSSHQKSRKHRKATARVLSDSIRVIPMAERNGVIIDMVLRLHKKQPEETQLIDIRVECPVFKPSRIRVDGHWYNIVREKSSTF